MSAIRFGAAVVLTAAVALVVGCANEAAKFGEVSGTVTYDGKPIEEGSITFSPDNGPTAGDAIKAGKFNVKKVSVGTSKVTITGVKITGKKKAYDDPNSPEVSIESQYLPAKYNTESEVKFDVKTGVQSKDFDLPK